MSVVNVSMNKDDGVRKPRHQLNFLGFKQELQCTSTTTTHMHLFRMNYCITQMHLNAWLDLVLFCSYSSATVERFKLAD